MNTERGTRNGEEDGTGLLLSFRVPRSVYRVLPLLLFAALTAILSAHPSVGIVLAPGGGVYYTDLEQVWHVDARGTKRLIVRGVHAHELFIDAGGTLYGEDSQYLGGDRYRNRVWKRTPDGRLSDAAPWRDGFWRTYGLTRDASGASYWTDCSGPCVVKKRDASGRVSTLPARFNTRVNWILATPAGEVYVCDGPDLRRIARNGTVSTVARVAGSTERHALLGLALDRAGNVYVASHWDRVVVRVTPNGQKRVVARSPAPWGPSGVAVAPNGDLWLLEFDVTRARVRRVSVGVR